MWSLSLLVRENGSRGEDKELARYAQLEYGKADAGWLVALARQQAKNRSKRGIRRRFSSLFRRDTGSAAVRSSELDSKGGMRTANDGGTVVAETFLREDCAHDDLRSLGSGGNAAYYRCQTCTSVVIAQGGKHWVLGPKSAE